MQNQQNEELALFQKRAVELLAGKFIDEYKQLKANIPCMELEHVYEVWSQNTIRENRIRQSVWRRSLQILQEKRK